MMTAAGDGRLPKHAGPSLALACASSAAVARSDPDATNHPVSSAARNNYELARKSREDRFGAAAPADELHTKTA